MYQNDTVERWFDYFSLLNEKENFYTVTHSSPYWAEPEQNPNDLHTTDDNWKSLRESLEIVKYLGVDVPFQVPAEFNSNQQVLNQLHRLFTFNTLKYEHLGHRSLMLINLQNINSRVHKLESFTEPEKNLRFIRKSYPLKYFNIFNAKKERHHWFRFDDNDLAHNCTYFDKMEDMIVTLDQSILGKSYYQSFAENDDPTQFDCTGRLGSFGGFNIDINLNRKSLYLSDKFKDWCDRWKLFPLHTIPLEFPIGYVSESSDKLINIYDKKNKIAEIKFIK